MGKIMQFLKSIPARLRRAFRTDEELADYVGSIELDNLHKEKLIEGLEMALVESRCECQEVANQGVCRMACLLMMTGGEVIVPQDVIDAVYGAAEVKIDILAGPDGKGNVIRLVTGSSELADDEGVYDRDCPCDCDGDA